MIRFRQAFNSIPLQAQHQKFLDNYQKAKRWLRSTIILMFLLGIQWSLNVVATIVSFNPKNSTVRDIFDYLSIVFNCSTGFFIFLYSVGCQRFQRYRSEKSGPKISRTTTSKSTNTKSTNRSLFTKSTKLSKNLGDQRNGSKSSDIILGNESRKSK